MTPAEHDLRVLRAYRDLRRVKGRLAVMLPHRHRYTPGSPLRAFWRDRLVAVIDEARALEGYADTCPHFDRVHDPDEGEACRDCGERWA